MPSRSIKMVRQRSDRRTLLFGTGDVAVCELGVVLANRTEDVQDGRRAIDSDRSMRNICWNQVQRSRFADSSFVANRQLHPSGNQHAALFMRMVMQRHFRSFVHFQIRKHQLVQMRRPHSAAGDRFNSFVFIDIDKRHLRAFNSRAWQFQESRMRRQAYDYHQLERGKLALRLSDRVESANPAAPSQACRGPRRPGRTRTELPACHLRYCGTRVQRPVERRRHPRRRRRLTGRR